MAFKLTHLRSNVETNSKFLGLKFLNTIDLMPPTEHTGTEMLFPRRRFTETPCHRSTSMYYKSSLQDSKKYSFVIVPQQIYSRRETDVDSSKMLN